MRGGTMRGRYQGGSLAGFIIIGAFLALIVVGGLYGLNRYNAEQAGEIAAETSDTSEPPTDSEEQNTGSEGVAEQEQQNVPGTDQQSTDEPTPADDETEPAEPQGSNQLPQTGPADIAIATLGVFALSFASTYYLRSRR